jgi:hypothetical protein
MLDAGVIGAARAEEVPVEVGQIVVAALYAFGKLPMPEPVPASGTDASLGPDDRGGQDVVAGGAADLPVGVGTGSSRAVYVTS